MKTYDKQNNKIKRLIGQSERLQFERDDALRDRDRLHGILDGIMHEIRRLNSELSSCCEDVSKAIASKNYPIASDHAEEAFYLSGLISSRLTFVDFEVNPESASRQAKYSAVVYKKFDKAKRVLSKSARRKNVSLRIYGSSVNKIEVTSAFDMAPFILIENAIKYSPRGQEVAISIEDNPSPGVRVSVVVSSMGPAVSEDEIGLLKLRGYRGRSVAAGNFSGQGLGLYLANILVVMVGGELSLSSSRDIPYGIDGVQYSEFKACIKFR